MTKTPRSPWRVSEVVHVCAWHLELGEKAGIGNVLVPALPPSLPPLLLLSPPASRSRRRPLPTLSRLRHYLEVAEDENGTNGVTWSAELITNHIHITIHNHNFQILVFAFGCHVLLTNLPVPFPYFKNKKERKKETTRQT